MARRSTQPNPAGPKEGPAKKLRAALSLGIAAAAAFAAALWLWNRSPNNNAPAPLATATPAAQKNNPNAQPQSEPLARTPVDPSTVTRAPLPPRPPARPPAPPITLGPAPANIPAPVTLAPAQLSVGDPTKADPMEFAFHPSHFADPARVSRTVSPVILSANPASKPAASGPATVIDPYAEAVRLEKARAFAMSLCLDLQGRLWVGSENTTPGDGTGGVQCYDPSKRPLEAWTQYLSDDSAAKAAAFHGVGVKGGLGDDNGYAVACDHQGRIWVGHLNHGISVFNGITWQNYEVVAGLSIPGSLNGPLGERIFKIVVAPEFGEKQEAGSKKQEEPVFHDSLTGMDSTLSGSVWMCTSAGLAIYFPSTDTWSYITRAEGMPSDQANSLAFGQDGSVYVATQCDGIAIATPNDDYKTWRQVVGPRELPDAAIGSGLPANSINDVVAKDGTIYAATTAGACWSEDGGKNWRYIRGSDYGARLALPAAQITSAALAEDFCTSLATSAEHGVLIGHRATPGDCFGSFPSQLPTPFGKGRTTSVLATSKGFLASEYGDGLTTSSAELKRLNPLSVSATAHPSGAKPPSLDQLETARGAIASSSSSPAASFLGDDWATQGDWVDHYGRTLAVLCAMGSPQDHIFTRKTMEYPYSMELLTDKDNDKPRSWVQTLVSNDARSLYDPKIGIRRTAGVDDHGEAYPRDHGGPGLGVLISVPTGLHRLSLYFMNDNGHNGVNADRDYELTLQTKNEGQWQGVTHARVSDCYGGVYKQFVVLGPASLRVAISKGTGLNVMCAGLFVDWAGTGSPTNEREPLLWMGKEHLRPAAIPENLVGGATPSAAVFNKMVSDSQSTPSQAASTRPLQILLYRLAISNTPVTAHEVLAQWKWQLKLQGSEDRVEFSHHMSLAWRAMQAGAPVLKDPSMRPFSPGTTAPAAQPKTDRPL